jgi:hypothetical protein
MLLQARPDDREIDNGCGTIMVSATVCNGTSGVLFASWSWVIRRHIAAPLRSIRKLASCVAYIDRELLFLISLALLLLPARSADRKKSFLPFGRRGGIASGLLNALRLPSLLLGFAGGSSCSLSSFRGRSLCGLAFYRLASDPLSFRDPDVASGDDLRSSLYSRQLGGVFRNCPGTVNLRLLRSAASS